MKPNIFFDGSLRSQDPDVLKSLEREHGRQLHHLEMIASENYTSRAVLEALGTILTNKYAEGYPGKRYYGGCEFVDEVENLARDRGKKLFSVPGFEPHINVQPHAGAQANQAVFLALLNPGDKILGPALPHGGHLTHGSPVNLSGKWFQVTSYGVKPSDEYLDMDQVRDLAKKEKPKMIITGFSAYSRVIPFAEFRAIADEVGAVLMVDMAHIAGLVAGGAHPSPFPHAHIVTSTTHKTLRGPRSGMILCHPDFAKKIDSAVFPGLQGGPLMHTIAAKAVMFGEALRPDFKKYAHAVVENSKALASALGALGFRVLSGGTDNHLCVLDVKGSKGVTGREAEVALDKAGINANRNTIPFDKESPFVTSGIRLGTPAITTRGMGLLEMKQVAELIAEAIANRADEGALQRVRKNVYALCEKFPIYPSALGRELGSEY